MRSIPNLAIVLGLAVVLSACAAATPGHIPDGARQTALQRAKPFDAGGVVEGVYQLSAAERELPCGKLRGSMAVIVARLKASDKPEPSAASANLQAAATAVRGKAIMMAPSEEARRDRARLDAYNGLLAEKQCPTMDFAAALAAVPKKP